MADRKEDMPNPGEGQSEAAEEKTAQGGSATGSRQEPSKPAKMLHPKENRLDYGSLLTPPEGYQLEFAVGTTFSLDLKALTTAILAMGSGTATDSSMAENPICLLEAMLQTADKVSLFCQQGRIQPPGKYTPLHALLDKCVFPVNVTRGEQSRSFHPKCWLLHFTPVSEEGEGKEDGKEDRYRFIVLSRNLTWDRSWDVAFSLEGTPGESSDEKNAPLQDFLNWLSNAGLYGEGQEKAKKLEKVQSLASGLNRVRFQLQSAEDVGDRQFNDFHFYPVGIYDEDPGAVLERLRLNRSYRELLVMSPFLSAATVDRLLKRKEHTLVSDPKAVLITRRASLPITKRAQRRWSEIYVLKEEAVYGENALSDGKTETAEHEVYSGQDIHAKLYMLRNGARTTLYLGSMNATESALAGNVEFMVGLETYQSLLKLDSLMCALCCGELGGKNSPFEAVRLDQVQEGEAQPDEEGNNLLRELFNKPMQAEVLEENGLYGLRVTFGLPDITGWTVTVRPLQANESYALPLVCGQTEIAFHGLSLKSLSEFYVFTVRRDIRAGTQGQEETVLSRVAVIPTTGIPEERRKREVITSIIDSKAGFYQYVAYLLGDDDILTALEAGLLGGEEQTGGKRTAAKPVSGLYEKLLKTAATAPWRLKRIQAFTDTIQGSAVVPEEFMKVYEAFDKAVNHG